MGGLIGTVLIGWCAVMALVPLRWPRRLAVFAWMSGMAPAELPVIYGFLVGVPVTIALATGGVATAVQWLNVALAVGVVAVLSVVAMRGLRARQAMDAALAQLSDGASDDACEPLDRPSPARVARELFAPLPVRPRSVQKTTGVHYGPSGHQLLDLYRHRSRESIGTFVHLHGGRFRSGGRSREARPLLHRFASGGWTCISADYRLSHTPGEGFPEHLIDVKRLLAWIRGEGVLHGADPSTIVLSGSSAGAHLTLMAALTAGDPLFQPGFEDEDTSIDAGVGLYGYYGPLDARQTEPASSPHAHVRPGAPPLLVVHGDNDTYTPVDGARSIVSDLRSISSAPVAYAELPGAQHSFDVFSSVRFDFVVDGVERFVAGVIASPRSSTPSAK